jgi:hypothetical protein
VILTKVILLIIKLKEIIHNELLKIVDHNYDIEDIEILRNEFGVKFYTVCKYTNKKEKGWVKYYGAIKSYQIYVNNTTIKIEDIPA